MGNHILLCFFFLIYLFYGGYPPQGTILKGGIGFWINAIYSYLLLIPLILILIEFFRSMKPIRRQVAIILLGMRLPWIGNMICLMGLSPFPEIDLTPFIFILSGGLFIVGITNFRFLDVRPIARSLLVENMKNGVIILNEILIVEEHNNQNPTGKQISFAVGYATGQSPDLPDEIFRKADQVMYLDKENYYKNRSGDRRHRIYSDFTENGTGSENILSSGS
ncbi:MAG: histidine kinase N-terminal 7TM domain-containing protein [Flexilinea sp.]